MVEPRKRKSDIPIGTRFGRLVVKADIGGNPRRYACVCDCGAETTNVSYHLLAGKSQSCGCYQKELVRQSKLTHKMSFLPEYAAWIRARSRCTVNHRNYRWYGARGIRMCDEWQNDFVAFYEHVGPCPAGYELDRKDNNKGYEPGNVRWVSRVVNMSNRRNSLNVMYLGNQMTLTEYSKLKGLPYSTVYQRLRKGSSDIDFELIENGLPK